MVAYHLFSAGAPRWRNSPGILPDLLGTERGLLVCLARDTGRRIGLGLDLHSMPVSFPVRSRFAKQLFHGLRCPTDILSPAPERFDKRKKGRRGQSAGSCSHTFPSRSATEKLAWHAAATRQRAKSGLRGRCLRGRIDSTVVGVSPSPDLAVSPLGLRAGDTPWNPHPASRRQEGRSEEYPRFADAKCSRVA